MTAIAKTLHINSQKLVDLALAKGSTIATAESCTGGYIAKCVTDIAGSSRIFKGSIVAYSNEIKINLLNINKKVLDEKGAVSEEIAVAMAQNVRTIMNVDIGIATTGIAGPSGGSDNKPVGLVFIAIAFGDKLYTHRLELRPKQRDVVRKLTTIAAINKTVDLLSSK